MAEPQPPNVVEGATAGDVEDEVTDKAKSAEDRKAAAAMSRLDANDDESGSAQVDQDAVNKAMKSLGGSGAGAAKTDAKKVKIDAADVALLVSFFPAFRSKVTEMAAKMDTH